MAKESFGTQLFKGFFRSAVQQVGRDGGKVISNKVYKDAHSTPIRGTFRNSPGQYVQEEPEVSDRFFSSSFWVYPFLFFGELVLSPLGVIYHLFKSFQYFYYGIKPEHQKLKTMLGIKSFLHLILATFFAWIAYYLITGFINSN